eukprot:6463570-Amphidinium_carterae.1
MGSSYGMAHIQSRGLDSPTTGRLGWSNEGTNRSVMSTSALQVLWLSLKASLKMQTKQWLPVYLLRTH